MKVNYALLKSKHYSSDRVSSNYMSGEDVYKEIGYNLADLKKQIQLMKIHVQSA